MVTPGGKPGLSIDRPGAPFYNAFSATYGGWTPAAGAERAGVGSMTRIAEISAQAAGLIDIYLKVEAGERLTFDDGMRLFESRELMAIGAMANLVRERKNRDDAYFVRNMHLNPTNVCTVDCKFCGFYRPYRKKDTGWTWNLERCLDEVRARLKEPLTEVHIVGGHNPDYPYEFYTDLIRGIRELNPGLHVKAFTAAEYDFFARRFKKPLEEVFADFKEAGLGSLPGGGAEVLVERVRQEIYPKKISAERWLEIVRIAHDHGLRSNATLLYGHVERLDERIEHMCRLRALQDETGGFMCFIPLAFHPENTELSDLPGPTGFDDLLTIAVSRLMLDNFDHIKAYWIMLTPRIAQTALNMGADCIDGTVVQEKIVHMAGATTPVGLDMDRLLTLIRDAGRHPVQRDSEYNELHRFEQPVVV
jgi:aminodeoxyfutalosine synthase